MSGLGGPGPDAKALNLGDQASSLSLILFFFYLPGAGSSNFFRFQICSFQCRKVRTLNYVVLSQPKAPTADLVRLFIAMHIFALTGSALLLAIVVSGRAVRTLPWMNLNCSWILACFSAALL